MTQPGPLPCGPLAGTRILDFTRNLAGPYATMMLADHGADVIKVETLPHGDTARGNGAVPGNTFLIANRGKRSIALDLRTAEGLAVVHRLAATADVVVESFRPGTADRMGIGHDRLAAINPRLTYLAISAFGRGPLETVPGTDPMVQALSGLVSLTGERDGPPVLAGVPIADFAAAMAGVQAVLLGLLSSARTGRGSLIEVSMLHALLSALVTRIAGYWFTGENPKRNGGTQGSAMPYQLWQTADGTVLAGIWFDRDALWPAFCDALDVPAIARCADYATNAQRVAKASELAPLLQAVFLTQTTAHWEERFRTRRILFAPVHTIGEILAHPHVLAAGMLETLQHPAIGALPQVAPVVQIRDTPAAVRNPPPGLGEHTADILSEAGYSRGEIAGLLRQGFAACVGAPPDGSRRDATTDQNTGIPE